MLVDTLLDLIITDGSGGVAKVYNGQLLSPLGFDKDQQVTEFEPLYIMNVPIMKESGLTFEDLDVMFVELLLEGKKFSRFDILDTDTKNIRAFIKRAIRDFKEALGLEKPCKKLAVLGADLSAIERPFSQLLRAFEYVEFLENPLLEDNIFIVPLDTKCGAIVTQGKSKQNYGMFVYEECVKKLFFYSDDDLHSAMSQLIRDLETGDL